MSELKELLGEEIYSQVFISCTLVKTYEKIS